MKTKAILAAVAGLTALTLVGSPAFAAPTQTGQGIMVNFTGANNYALVQNKLYSFNIATAATYFTNVWDQNSPVVSCTGSPTNCANPAPAAPQAPAPNQDKVTNLGNGVAVTNMCTFLDGGSLVGSSYTQAVQVSVGTQSTQRTYTYTYTYVITPTGSVAAFTAWDLTQTTGGETVPVTISAEIAGESATQSTNLGRKYSFSMRNSDNSSRVTGLNLTVDNVPYPIGSTIQENCPGCKAGDVGAVDFTYTTNAGSNGVTSLLANGNARDILNTDSFTGNQDGGADGKALAKAVTDAVTVNLAPGDHSVVLTGTVKGNSALSNIAFSISQTIHIIAGQCTSPVN